MKRHFKIDKWKVIEEGFDPDMQEAAESLFGLGNGRMGQRANFEETYSGKTFQGTYIAGIYYPDKTKVGWWKNGYPEYFAKVLNAPNWIGIKVLINDTELDLARCKILSFYRELNMQQGFLLRKFTAELSSGNKVKIESKRFLSMTDDEIGLIRYKIKALNFTGNVKLLPFLDGYVKNRDANFNEIFWDVIRKKAENGYAYILSKTRKSGFEVCMSMNYELEKNGKPENVIPEIVDINDLVGNEVNQSVKENDEICLYKYVSVISSLNYKPEELIAAGRKSVKRASQKKFHLMFEEHAAMWDRKWSHSDILIEGDEAAQQSIRFNIFHLNQTYTGRDEKLNIGPKGFTGEKYGGSTYWDTEAFLIPFYLSTASPEVSRNLLIYRYNHLKKAIENAHKLGFRSGAALYPMVTMNGEECHNEWEITFEEIHRNGAIAFAIFNYIRYTKDIQYLAGYGLEVLIGISRFWEQRVSWSAEKGKYVILGVTGPNEYENNVNNNWYTNKMAVWTLKYTLEALRYVKKDSPERFREITHATDFHYESETREWKKIIDNMYFPRSEEHGIFLQQDGFLDKVQLHVSDLAQEDLPLNRNWSWDRILRSVFIKQADVLQGIFHFEDEFDDETIRRHYEFYEPRTVHESSLSPCIHSVIAAKTGKREDAYNLYLRTARLDLDDYNHEVDEGLHITSMGGTWMSVVYGFGGMRIKNNLLSFHPLIPHQWGSLSFRIIFRQNTLRIRITHQEFELFNEEGPKIRFLVDGKELLCGKEKAMRVQKLNSND